MSLPWVAKQMAAIPFAGIRRVFEKAARLEADGIKVIHFEIGRPDFDTPSHIKEAASKALEGGMVHYTPNAGIQTLREAVAESIEKYKGIHYNPLSEIMATAGGQEAMYLSLQAIIEPGDEILVPDPGFSQFNSCTKLAGGVPIPLPLLAAQNFIPDLEAAKKRITRKTKAIIVNSPHNPTGAVITAKQMETICQFANQHGLVVLSDEAYDRILFENADFISPAALPDMKQKTVMWGSLSKTYAMTGWRIGYLAGPKELIEAAVKIQQNLMLSLCSFAQAGAVAALKGPQECVDEMVAEFDRRRKVILDGIDRSPGLSCPTIPLGAFYVFAKHDVPGMDSDRLADYFLEQGGVAAVSGSPFGSGGEGFIRISYATAIEDCKEGMERITRLMTELTNRS
jgi:aspartate/methionine/tyrosine aminotransferase